MDYKGRVAFITGGAGGIGEALGRLFLEKGCKVCLVDIRADVGKVVLKKLQDEFGKTKAIFAKCDVTSDKEFEDAYNTCEKKLGKITILCNNAGIFAKDYRTSMDINFGAVVRGTELGLKRMGKHNGGEGGYVVNTASIIGAMRFPFTPMYCATKAAVIHYTRCMGTMDYKGRVVFITGGAGGIGEALGRLLLEKGCKVCLADIRADEGKSVVQNLQDNFGKTNVLFAKCDVTSDKEFEDAYNICEKQLGKITILCNNAGVFLTDYRTTMDINFGAVVRGTELALKRMGKHNGGEGGFVVNTASQLGAIRFPFSPMYCASKAAVIHYTRCMGHEFNYDYSGVHILCMCPGPVETPLIDLESLKKGTLKNINVEKAVVEIGSKILKIKPREIAETILQLIEEHKPGAALVIETPGGKPFYIEPSLLTEYT